MNGYLNSMIIQRGKNTKKCLRQVFILYKKDKNPFSTLAVEKFFIPVYTHVVDTQELLSDYVFWKDYLSKWMNLRGKSVHHVFTSLGFVLTHLNQVSVQENILIIQGLFHPLFFLT